MQTTQRQHEPGLIQGLLEAPHRFQFAQLLNILIRMLRQQGITYDQAFSQVLRFRNSQSLAFPPSEVESLQIEHSASMATPPSERLRIYVTPAFIGLLGSSGTLPLHYTELAADIRMSEPDESWHRFIDLFSNRAVGLHYRAWAKYRVEHGLDTRGEDNLLPMLTALAGLRHGDAGPDDSDKSVSDEIKGYYAALLRTRPIAVSTIERVLTEYFGVPIRLEEFVGAWSPIAEKKRSTLGVTRPILGFGAALGTRTWRNDRWVRLHIGPLTVQQAQDFLPNGRALAALQEMVGLFAAPSLKYEIKLLLEKACIKPLTLATKPQDQRRLGWNTFLTSTPGKASRPDIRLILRLPTSRIPQVRNSTDGSSNLRVC
jgi:type VI secretion system protein ImpH